VSSLNSLKNGVSSAPTSCFSTVSTSVSFIAGVVLNEVKLKTLKDKDLLRPITIDNDIRIMEDIIDEIKAKHTAPDDVKLKRLEKKFEPVEKILREGRLPKYTHNLHPLINDINSSNSPSSNSSSGVSVSSLNSLRNGVSSAPTSCNLK
jgi:hypothetical protein